MALTDGLVAYYKLDNTLLDVVGTYSLTGSSPVYTTGKIITGLSIGYGYTTGKILTGSSGTISAWVYSTSFTSTGRIFGYGGSSVNGIFSFEVRDYSGMKLSLTYRKENGTGLNIISGSTTLSTSTWHHVVLVSTGSAYKIYLNGVEETLVVQIGSNNGAWNDLVTETSGYSSIKILRNGGIFAPSTVFTGVLDEIGFWNRAISPGEVRDLYGYGSGQQYPFNDKMFMMF